MSPGRSVLVIRADAGPKVGTGHLMRCQALAQAWKDHDGETIFVTCCETPALKERLVAEGYGVIELPDAYPAPCDLKVTLDALKAHPGAWLVLDGYHFDSNYQRKIKDAGHKLMVVDDMAHLDYYYADIVLNQNIHSHQLHYVSEPCTRFLLGPKYVLLRREFMAWRGYRRETPTVARKILVTMGGSDEHNVTSRVIEALSMLAMPNFEAKVVVGAANPHISTVVDVARISPCPIEVLVNPSNMPELMAWADLAITAGGTTVYELLYMGVPSLAFTTADNQNTNVKVLSHKRLIDSCQDRTPSQIAQTVLRIANSPARRSEMTRLGQLLIDGNGPGRLISALKGLSVRLRSVREEDAFLLWEWANDPEVREASFSSQPIPWDEHITWFRQKLCDPNCLIFIAEDEKGIPIGQIRFDIKGREADVGISIAPEQRNKGCGTFLLNMAVQKVFDVTMVERVNAFVKVTNEASKRAFEKAGFKVKDYVLVREYPSIHYTRDKASK